MPLGIYLSVPFCRTKCSYCNFASDVFSRAVFDRYVNRLCADIDNARKTSCSMGGEFDLDADSIYLGGGTPTVLAGEQLSRIFTSVREQFCLSPSAEITVECAPGTLTLEMIDILVACGVNRVSLGVQSFVDGEAAAVGRLHKRATVFDDIARLRAAGISNINVDLIAGLPHQTAESWKLSVEETITTGVPHVSVYMLEVDENSRLGRELMAGGTRYHAHFVPDENETADYYLEACDKLNAAGIAQYEISNFARPGFESRHNLRYWTRQPYLGFGVDAHSMLISSDVNMDAVRFAGADSLESYVCGAPQQPTVISREAALEETFFLGLRLTDGLSLAEVAAKFGSEVIESRRLMIAEMTNDALLERAGDRTRLTSRGRLLSNEVFERFLSPDGVLP